MLRRVFTRSAITNHIAKSLAAALVPGTILLASLQPQRAEALVLFTIREINGKVEVTTSGTYSTEALTIDPTSNSDISAPSMRPNLNYLLTGLDTGIDYYYADLKAPSSLVAGQTNPFGSIGFVTDVSGVSQGTATAQSVFGFYFDPDTNIAPLIYVGSTATCSLASPCAIDNDNGNLVSKFNLSYSDLGLTPGTFTWYWGSNDISERIQVTIEPVPAPLPLLGGAAAFGWSRRLRRRVRAAKLKSLTEARA